MSAGRSALSPGASVVLEDNGGNALTVSANGPFTFTTPVMSGAAYAVTVHTQPAGQTCNVSAGAGTVGAAAITGVVVTCGSGVTVGGTINGLSAGDSLALADNGGSTLFVTSNGPFAFPTALANGAAYDVTISSNPAVPVTETCTVAKGTGTVGTTNVTSVAVTCKPSGFTIGGTVTGLAAGDTVVLQDNALDNLQVSSNGPFTFASPIGGGLPYAVTVLANPTAPPQTCVVTGGAGVVGIGNVTSVAITCTNTYTIGGTLSGLAGGDTVVLQDNGANNLSLNANGAFAFTTPIVTGLPYAVTVLTNPIAPAQQCLVTAGGPGTVGSANVTNVAVTCTTTFTVGVMLTGLVASNTVVLQDNGGDNLSLSANGTFVSRPPSRRASRTP